jgi:hypothetical protein
MMIDESNDTFKQIVQLNNQRKFTEKKHLLVATPAALFGLMIRQRSVEEVSKPKGKGRNSFE